jgi:hypothetical protein
LIDEQAPSFLGPISQAVFGGPVPVSTELAHWRDGIQSIDPRTGATVNTTMDPTTSAGERTNFTRLDYAALDDIGWDLGPEPVPLAADFNLDGRVGIEDFDILKLNFGGSFAARRTGDANGDAVANLDDFSILKSSFGSAAGLLDPLGVTHVPEPAAWTMAGLGVICSLLGGVGGITRDPLVKPFLERAKHCQDH